MAATALVGGRQLVGATPRQDHAPLDERVAVMVKSDILAAGVPSVSVAVLRDGKMLLERAWGVADIEKNVGASNSTTYPVGSLTKQFTAALVLEQVERGRLTLTGPIGKHLAGLTAEVGAMTIEQLPQPHPRGEATGHTSELQWYVEGSIAYAMLCNSGPRTPGISDLIPRVVMGVPLPDKSK